MYRTVLLARACAYTGAIMGGIFTGQALFLLITGTGDLLGAILPLDLRLAGVLRASSLPLVGPILIRTAYLQDGTLRVPVGATLVLDAEPRKLVIAAVAALASSTLVALTAATAHHKDTC